jgi:hypothetical protein
VLGLYECGNELSGSIIFWEFLWQAEYMLTQKNLLHLINDSHGCYGNQKWWCAHILCFNFHVMWYSFDSKSM